MSTARLAVAEPSQNVDVDFDAFARDLTELSLKHRIGIAGDPVLFVLEDIDLDRVYTSDADSRLTY